jgi:hypothetical protein
MHFTGKLASQVENINMVFVERPGKTHRSAAPRALKATTQASKLAQVSTIESFMVVSPRWWVR